jgi:hypothetical protein
MPHSAVGCPVLPAGDTAVPSESLPQCFLLDALMPKLVVLQL